MRRHPVQHFKCRPAVFSLHGLGVLVCLLAIIGAGLADDLALAKRNVGSPLQTIVADIPVTAPDAAGHSVAGGCAIQVACPVFIAVADAQPGVWEQSFAGIPAYSRFRSGRTTTPISPPPKPTRQA